MWSENDEKARKTAPIEELLEFIKNYHSDVISLDYQDERLAEGCYKEIRDFLKANN